MDKIKVVIIGCGRIAHKHAEAINQNPNLKLTTVMDINKEKASLFAKKYNVKKILSKIYNFNDIIMDECIVAICTPSGTHTEIIGDLLSYGNDDMHIITEKPIATKWKDATDLLGYCNIGNVYVNKQNRTNPTIKTLKESINKGKFGKIYYCNINIFWNRNQQYYDQDEWRGTWLQDGGALMNQASHYIDLFTHLIGEVESVQCLTTTNRNIEVEDSASINIKFRNGCLGSMAVTMMNKDNNEGSITIIGENGIVKIGGVAVNKVEKWDIDNYNIQNIDTLNYETESVYGNGHIEIYKNLVNVIQNDAKPICSYKEGLKSLEVIIACYLSARNNKTINLPLDY